MVDNWLSMNDIEDFQMRIYTTVREMYTVIKSQDAPASSVGANFKWVQYSENLKAPRIDKLIEKHRAFRIAAVGSNTVNQSATIDASSKPSLNLNDSLSP